MKTRKNRLALFVLMITLMLWGCAKVEVPDNNKEEIKDNVLTMDIINTIKGDSCANSFVNDIDQNAFSYMYLDMDMTKIKDVYGAYISPDKADIILVVRAIDDQGDYVKEQLEKGIEEQKNIFKSADQSQYERLTNSKTSYLRKYDDYVVYVVSSQKEEIVELVENMIVK